LHADAGGAAVPRAMAKAAANKTPQATFIDLSPFGVETTSAIVLINSPH
jgi:hypothetical protein